MTFLAYANTHKRRKYLTKIEKQSITLHYAVPDIRYLIVTDKNDKHTTSAHAIFSKWQMFCNANSTINVVCSVAHSFARSYVHLHAFVLVRKRICDRPIHTEQYIRTRLLARSRTHTRTHTHSFSLNAIWSASYAI